MVETLLQPDNGHVPDRTRSSGDSIIIRMRNLTIKHNDSTLIGSIDLDIPGQRATAILGPEASGKSIFLKSINRLNDIDRCIRTSGSILFNGIDIYNKDIDISALRQQIGYIARIPHVFPRSVFDNIAFGPRLRGIRRRARLETIVERALSRARLWLEMKNELKKNALLFTPELQQRICIARALALDPEILMFDEPAIPLDSPSTSVIQELIRDLSHDCTVIFATRNGRFAARSSDYAVFMVGGSVVEHSDTKTIFTRPAHRETEDYITSP